VYRSCCSIVITQPLCALPATFAPGSIPHYLFSIYRTCVCKRTQRKSPCYQQRLCYRAIPLTIESMDRHAQRRCMNYRNTPSIVRICYMMLHCSWICRKTILVTEEVKQRAAVSCSKLLLLAVQVTVAVHVLTKQNNRRNLIQLQFKYRCATFHPIVAVSCSSDNCCSDFCYQTDSTADVT
jgi:hypothetical protein